MAEPIPLREESDVERVLRLQKDVSSIGDRAARQWLADLNRLHERATEIISMGDAVPVGVRELVTREAAHMLSAANTLSQILGRIRA